MRFKRTAGLLAAIGPASQDLHSGVGNRAMPIGACIIIITSIRFPWPDRTSEYDGNNYGNTYKIQCLGRVTS